jgi:hypothetical protein
MEKLHKPIVILRIMKFFRIIRTDKESVISQYLKDCLSGSGKDYRKKEVMSDGEHTGKYIYKKKVT